MSHHHRRAAAISAPDPYFQNTVLLLTGNGTNGGQNNTFIDSSSNNFTITRYGNTTQGSFSPFGWQWSNYFDGSGDYLVSSTNSSVPATGDFTLEGWIFFPSSSANNAAISIGNETTGRWAFLVNPNGNLGLDFYGISPPTNIGGTCTVGVWNHFAFVRSGSTVTGYLNGSQTGTTTKTGTAGISTGGIYIWGTSAGARSVAGYLSNVRWVVGTAVYSGSSFTVPTSPLTAISGTQLLTCQSNRFIDNSSNAFAITPSGDARVTNFAPFATGSEYSTGTNGGSGYFDGSGDYLTAPAGSSYDFGSGNFTVECWVYTTTSSGNAGIVGVWGTSTAKSWILYRLGTTWRFYYDGPSGSPVSASVSVATNTWVHLAVVRNGSTITIYVDGTSAGSNSVGTTSLTQSLSQSLAIGANLDTGPTNYFTGFISSLRILKGTAQYTTNFTPSTTPLTAITNTQLLLNFTNGSIVDATGKNDLETVGNAQISTSVKKYGTGSLKFDGTGDYLSIPDSSVFDLGSGDFTLETWVNFSALPPSLDAWTFASQWKSSSPLSLGWFYYLFNNTGTYVVYFSYSTTGSSQLNIGVNLASAPSIGTWYHYAICRSGSNLRFFVDGTQIGSTQTLSATIFNSTSSIWIGAQNNGSAGYQLNGYLDDFRLTKYARYSSAFTPPTRQLPAR